MKNTFRTTIAAAAAAVTAASLLAGAVAGAAVSQGSGLAGDIDLKAPHGSTIAFGGSSFSAPFVNYTTTGAKKFPNANVSFGTDSAAGSGDGRTGVEGGTYNIGFSDQPLNVAAGTAPTGLTQGQVDADYAQVPYVLGGAVIGYNLAGIKNLNLSAKVIDGIYEGKITSWNNAAIKALNPKVKNLPNEQIKVLFRSKSSGTTFALTDWLHAAGASSNKVSGNVLEPTWGASNSTGVSNNATMASTLNSTPGAIGYVEYSYVLIPGNAKIQVANLQDASGAYIAPSLKSIAAAASAAKKTLSSANFSIVYQKGTGVWPLATYSWAIVKKAQSSAATGEDVVKYLDWATHNGGQQYATANGYVPLPAAAQAYARAQLLTVKSGSTVLVSQKN